MPVRELLNDNPDREYLLRHILGMERAEFFARRNEHVAPRIIRALAALERRRARGVPVQYLVGESWFYGLKFFVSPAVLIPRPETELIVDRALTHEPRAGWTVVDVGTGSGAIAVTLASRVRNVKIYATDISARALAVARRNSRTHRTRIVFMKKNLLTGVPWPRTPNVLITANLPYLTAAQMNRLSRDVRYEPRRALFGDNADGLGLYEKLFTQISRARCTGQHLVVLAEIEPTQQKKFTALTRRKLPSARLVFLNDLHGDVRCAEIILF